MSKNTLTINGVDVTETTLGISEVIENVSLNDKNKTVTRAVSSEVQLTLEGFDLIKETFLMLSLQSLARIILKALCILLAVMRLEILSSLTKALKLTRQRIALLMLCSNSETLKSTHIDVLGRTYGTEKASSSKRTSLR